MVVEVSEWEDPARGMLRKTCPVEKANSHGIHGLIIKSPLPKDLDTLSSVQKFILSYRGGQRGEKSVHEGSVSERIYMLSTWSASILN